MNPAPSISIRRADINDAATLARLGAATFTETFGHLYPPEDLQQFLTTSHSLESWQRLLSDAQRAVWVCELPDATAVGYICVGRCKLPIDNCEPKAGEVQQLYLLSDYHNLGLGARLMGVGFDWLDSQEFNPLYIGVWSENFGAQRFYARYGFEKVGEYGFPVGTTVDREFILKRRRAKG